MAKDDPLIGQKLGEFKILELLGAGGMGKVYLAEQAGLERKVAVKVLPKHVTEDEAAVARFEREAKLAARLTHPNIGQVYSIGAEGETHFVALELITGGDVAGLMKAKGRVPVDEGAEIVRQALQGLGSAHLEGIVHRDIKPQNIMLSAHRIVKVMDFGLARALAADSSLTASGTVLGTPLYMSPEQANSQPVDERTDIYALGAAFYHMICGRPPFEGDTPISVMYKHVNEPLPSPREIDPDIPEEVCAVIDKMMAKRPDDRYQTCEGALADLEPFCQAHPAKVSPVPGGTSGEADRTMAISGAGDEAEEGFPSIEVKEGADADRVAETQAAPPDYSEVVKAEPEPKPKKKAKKKKRKEKAEPVPEAESVVREAQTQISKSHEMRLGRGSRRRRTAVQEAEARKRMMLFGGAIAAAVLVIGLIYWAANRPKGERPEPKDVTTIGKAATSTTTTVKPSVEPPARYSWTEGCVLAFSFEVETLYEKDGKQFVRDLSGNGHDGELHARVNPKPINDVLQCNGRDSYVTCGYSAALDFERDQPFTLCAAIRQTDGGASEIMGNFDGLGSQRGYLFHLRGGKVIWEGLTADGKGFSVSAEAAYEIGTWRHVAVTYDGKSLKDGCKIYINGQVAAAKASPNHIPGSVRSPADFRVGGRRYKLGGSQYFYCGELDEVAVWRRVLSAEELKSLLEVSAGAKGFCRLIAKARGGAAPDIAYTNSLGMKFVEVPAGEFMMGLTREQVEADLRKFRQDSYAQEHKLSAPQHKARLTRNFLMGRHEVTVAQFREFVEATQHETEAETDGGAQIISPEGKWEGKADATWRKPYGEQRDDHPVVCVSWDDANAFCDWLNRADTARPKGLEYRLPTEAEWEYAARGPKSLLYPWGDTWDGARCNAADTGTLIPHRHRDANDGHGTVAPVGSFSPGGDSPFGIADLSGNVWEWCGDSMVEAPYSSARASDPVETRRAEHRVIRGGSWYEHPGYMLSGHRDGARPSKRTNHIGFRVVLAPAGAGPRYVGPWNIRLLRIPAGDFMMGSTDEDIKMRVARNDEWAKKRFPTEAPQHKVSISQDFFMGQFEVTVGQFRRFVESTNYKTEVETGKGQSLAVAVDGKQKNQPGATWREPGFRQMLDHPVVCVNWHDAKAFCDWLNGEDKGKPKGWRYRLPTEAEWEYAAGGPNSLLYPWGNEWDAARCNAADKSAALNYGHRNIDDGHARTAPVGTYSPRGDSPFGLAEMAGNVCEWCEDLCDPVDYGRSATDGPPNGEIGPARALRGEGWNSVQDALRTKCRGGYAPHSSTSVIGFRVVLAPVEASDAWAEGCVLALSFDGDSVKVENGKVTQVRDVSGRGNHPNVRGGTRAEAKCGTGIRVVNETHGLLCDQSESLKITGDLTMAVWVKGGPKQEEWARIFHTFDWNAHKGFGLCLVGNRSLGGEVNGGCLELWAVDDKMYGAFSKKLINDETWHHLVGVFDRDSIRVYLDGQLEDEKKGLNQLELKPHTNRVCIGTGEAREQARAFRGVYDEVALWRRALPEDEVRQLYAYSSAGKSYCEAIRGFVAPGRSLTTPPRGRTRRLRPGIPHTTLRAGSDSRETDSSKPIWPIRASLT